jgi:Leucine-rich repeat (LRR) protein
MLIIILVVSMQDLAGHIKSLDACRNHLTSLHASGTQHLGSSLQQLSLSRNKLQDVPGLALLANLRVLDLSRNHVRDIQPLQVGFCSTKVSLNLRFACWATTHAPG